MSPIEQGIKAKIEAVGTPLKDWDIRINYGIKTGCNEAFIIDGSVRDRLINADPKSDEIIRPILRGRDIKRYEYEWAGLYVIMAYYGSHKIIPIEYPAIYTHLKQYEDKLKARGQCRYTANGSPRVDADKVGYPGQHHWLELDNNPRQEYMDDFSKQKIVWAETMRIHRDNTSNFPRFAFCAEPMFTDKTCFIATSKKYSHFILGFMNSEIGRYSLKRNVSILDDGGYLLQKVFLETILLPVADAETIDEIENLVRQSLDNEILATRKKIDILFYHLLSFSEDEIRFIEEDNAKLLSRG